MNNMDITIIEPTIDFDFSKLHLGPPTSITGGAYFTRIYYNSKPFCVQVPKTLTKQGFIKSGKKMYTDLMFTNNDSIFIQWVENLEEKCQELIFQKREEWFQSSLDKNDIETAFTSPIKVYKSGKFYLLRSNVKQNIKIYNDNDDIISSDDIKTDTNVICIIEIQGIKFTSRNFQVEIEIKQAMVVSPDPFLDSCFIKRPNNTSKHVGEQLTSIETHKEIVPSPSPTNAATSSAIIENPILDLEDLDEITRKNTEANSGPPLNTTLTISDGDLEENIELEFEDLEPVNVPEKDELKEVDITPTNTDTMTLKKPNQVYYEIYKAAKEKAKEAKQVAINAYLEAKKIKKTYMLEDLDESESDSEVENLSDNDPEPEFYELH
jgi:Family of unknown function (DUF5871)